jgi:hypothetical protein
MAQPLFHPTDPSQPTLAQQIFELCKEAAESAGGFLVPHPEEHTITVVYGGQQVTITVEARLH